MADKKPGYRDRHKRHSIPRLYFAIIFKAASCARPLASSLRSLLLLSLIPQLIRSFFPAGCIFITFAAKMICALRGLQVCRLRASLLNQASQDLRILQHRTWTEHVLIKWLVVVISLENRALQCVQKRSILDIAV